jgi:hypothetical protein
MASLTPETFLAVAQMVAGHLRLKADDRWSPHVCRLKFHSFTSEFPEVSEAQFMWAAERWIQGTEPGAFLRYPTWAELMAPLYRTEAGRANRSWGPRDDLPPFVRFKPDQLALLPGTPESVLPPPDQQNPAAYQVVSNSQPALPPAAAEPPGVSDEEWEAYLKRVQEEAAKAQEEATCNS